MALQDVPADAWLDLGVLAVKSAVQCRGAYDIVIGTGATEPSTEQDGVLLAPREAIPIEALVHAWARPATPGQKSTVNVVAIAI